MRAKRPVSPEPQTNSTKKHFIRSLSFQTVSFYSEPDKRQVVILYSLGEDGVIREYTGGSWKPFPILE